MRFLPIFNAREQWLIKGQTTKMFWRKKNQERKEEKRTVLESTNQNNQLQPPTTPTPREREHDLMVGVTAFLLAIQLSMQSPIHWQQ